MTDRIDHAAEATALLENYAPDYTVALVHATLALAQEQRTRNLIALFQVADEDAVDFGNMGLSYPEVFAEIREALGL